MTFRRVKQPAEEVGPWTLLHDQINGMLTVEFHADLLSGNCPGSGRLVSAPNTFPGVIRACAELHRAGR
ncbi:MAG TPA: hypothetical protein VLZ05_28945 [Mycobacterium sp.]|nr:hypothetical protein [Mycobacterium sp.]HUH72514.1 hypothetical protein [Mycobacterium sp.]